MNFGRGQISSFIFLRLPLLAVFASIVVALFFSSRSFGQALPTHESLKITEVLFEDYNGENTSRWDALPGQEMIVRFRLDGYGRLPELNKDGLPEDQITLRYRIALKDPRGVLIEPEKSGEVSAKIRQQDTNWHPLVEWSARIPSYAPPGNYSVEIHASDLIDKKEAAKNALFRVMGQIIPTSDHLEVSRLEYAASEKGPWNAERYFAMTDTIWIRYNIIGFKIAPESNYWIEHDWKVLDPDGKEVVSNPVAIVEKERQYYPPSFLPSSLNLTLNQPKEGKYTLHIEVRDRIADQSVVVDSPFYIRP
jgi:hypothetical protein